MLIAILSDIHANDLALEAVLMEAEKKQVERYFILGDLIGYYFWPKEVLELLKSKDCTYIRGNHENLLNEYIEGDSKIKNKLKSKYGEGFDYCIEKLDEESITFLNKLPTAEDVNIDNYVILLAHGSPLDTNEYIYPDAPLEILKRHDSREFDFIFLGHTHYPMNYEGTYTRIINPGSVGQSRVRGGVADWGILETSTGEYIQMHTPYDKKKLQNKITELGTKNKYLIEILQRNS